ncbi:hypothetical protein NYV36_18930 [Escherichia coli]|nr:hypothetical protein [Escherichia coli]
MVGSSGFPRHQIKGMLNELDEEPSPRRRSRRPRKRAPRREGTA